MAGENPDEPHIGRAPTSSCPRPKWDRFRILIAGPVMNIVLAVVLMTVVLAQGAQVPAFEDDPVDVGVVTKGSPAEQGGIQPGDRIIKVGSQRTWRRGRSSSWPSAAAPIARRADHAAARGTRDGRHGDARRRRPRCRSATSACCPTCTRASASVEAGGPGRQGRPQGRRRRHWRSTARPIVFSGQLSAAIRKHPDEPITLTRPARRRRRSTSQVTPRRQGDDRPDRHRHRRTRSSTIQPGPARRVRS